jgi:hypothetical protein
MPPLAINLAAVAVNELPGLDRRPRIFRSKPVVRVLESHDWVMVAIADTIRLLSNSRTIYVSEHLYYLPMSTAIATLTDLN